MWFKRTGDARLERCCSEDCAGQATERLEADGIGSNYCSGCRSKIEIDALRKALEQIANGYLGDQTAEQQFVWAQRTARAALDAQSVQ